MLTITKTNTCSEINIKSTLLSDFIDPQTTITDITLFYTYNNGTEKSYTVQVGDITVDTISLDPDFFEQTTSTLCDGIYCFRLEVTDNNELTKYRGSILVDCSLVCKIAEILWNDPSKLVYSKLEAIKYYGLCNACDCSTTYNLYLDLLCELGISNTPCGCSQ